MSFFRWCRSRQDLEQDYYREWEATTVLAAEEGKRKLTAVTLLAFLPTFVKFYLVGEEAGTGRLRVIEDNSGVTEALRRRAQGTQGNDRLPARPLPLLTARPPAGAGPCAVCVVLHLDGSATRRLQAAQGGGAGRYALACWNAACSWSLSWRAHRCKPQRARSLMAACLLCGCRAAVQGPSWTWQRCGGVAVGMATSCVPLPCGGCMARRAF